MKKNQNILELKPTQFAVGMLEIDEKLKIARRFSKKQRQEFIRKNPVPIVIGPEGDLYVTDHHHFLCVCYNLGIKKVRVKVIANLQGRKISYKRFWHWMLRQKDDYLFCQFGEGPRPPFYLPRDIRGLADDPYRSLAWYVRQAGAYQNSDKNFAEFKWANFFRSRKIIRRTGPDEFSRALKKATRLAQSKLAKHLPGFDELDFKQRHKTDRRIKRLIRHEMKI